MKQLFSFFLISAMFVVAASNIIYAQSDEVYNEGTVWTLSFIRVKANATEDYLKGIKNTWEASAREQVKAGLIKSYKIFLGSAANEQDFNLILMEEYPNLAAMDPTPEKLAAGRMIDKKVEENMKGEFEKTVSNYENIRKWMGMKVMREITLN